MMGPLLLVLVGMAILAAGGEALVRGAVSLARLLRVSTAVIGLTIVAMGTSAPELAVSLLAAAQGKGDIAIGNVVGSNIFNVAMIVGLAALAIPLVVHLTAIRLEWPFMFVILAVGMLLARDGVVDRLEGAFLLVALAVFSGYMVRVARAESASSGGGEIEAAVESRTVRSANAQVAIDAGLVALGVGLLVAGASVLVRGAVAIAELAGLSERVIGLTIVAAGTSLPELATSIVAARKNQPDIALANVIGSNIFNIAGILGVVALVTPQSVNAEVIRFDMWWMLGYALILWPIMRTGWRVSRLEGGLLVAGYGVYLWMLLR
jgi:cation:H+ antiporter